MAGPLLGGTKATTTAVQAMPVVHEEATTTACLAKAAGWWGAALCPMCGLSEVLSGLLLLAAKGLLLLVEL